MVKVEVIENFTLKKFNELKNIERKNRDEQGKLFKGDTFECSEEMARYLSGENKDKKVVVEIVSIETKEKEIETSVEYTNEEIEPKATIKKATKKKKIKKEDKNGE